MLTYTELTNLRDRLINDGIDLESAKAECWNDFREGKRSWHTRDWKERRSAIIKDKCEICCGKDTLTLQHLSHPRKYADYLAEITREAARDHITINPDVDKCEYRNYIFNEYDYFPVPLCPSCEGRNPNGRMRKIPKYLCRECRHEFDVPIYKTIDELISIFHENECATEVRDKCFITKNRWKNNHNLSNIKYWLQREKAKVQDNGAIEKKAFLLYLEDNIKYLSFEDTITACKKCASSFDLLNLELCTKCRMYYKGIQYPTCIQCLPEDKRTMALDSIEFGKRWSDMEKDLGID